MGRRRGNFSCYSMATSPQCIVYVLKNADKPPRFDTGEPTIDDVMVRAASASDVTPLERDVWYHVGMLCPPGGDIQLYLNGVAVGTKTGAQATPASETICKRLTFGARTGSTITNFIPARYADSAWWSNAVPNAGQITALAAKTRPNALTGTAATYWWAFNQGSTTEPSLGAAATLTATGAPTTVLGPVFTTTTPIVVRRPLDFILV